MAKALVVALVAFLAFVLASMQGAEAAVSPGAVGAVSRNGVQQIIDQVYPPLVQNLQYLKIDDVSGKQSGFLYSFSNFKVEKVSVGAIPVTTDGVLGVAINDLDLKCSMDFSYRKKGIPWIPRGSGWLEINMGANTIGGKFAVNTRETPQGTRPTVVVQEMNVDLENFKAKVHGSIFSWLYNLILNLFKGAIRRTVQKFVRETLTNAVNNASENILATLPMRSAITRWGAIDYSLTNAMSFAQGNIVASLSGEILDITTNKTDGATERHGLVFPGTTRMLCFAIDSFLVNSGLHVYHGTHRFDRVYTEAEHPALFPLGFNTDFYKTLIPALPAKLPGAPLHYKMTGRRESQLTISEAGVAFAASPSIAFLAADESVLLALDIDLHASVAVSIAPDAAATPTIYINIGDVKPVFSVRDSTVGPVDLSLLNVVLNSLIDGVILPAVNNIFASGIPILAVKGMSLSNTSLRTQDHTLIIETDVDYTPPAKVLESALATVAVRGLMGEDDHAVHSAAFDL